MNEKDEDEILNNIYEKMRSKVLDNNKVNSILK
jgi:hypothetical protein